MVTPVTSSLSHPSTTYPAVSRICYEDELFILLNIESKHSGFKLDSKAMIMVQLLIMAINKFAEKGCRQIINSSSPIFQMNQSREYCIVMLFLLCCSNFTCLLLSCKLFHFYPNICLKKKDSPPYKNGRVSN